MVRVKTQEFTIMNGLYFISGATMWYLGKREYCESARLNKVLKIAGAALVAWSCVSFATGYLKQKNIEAWPGCEEAQKKIFAWIKRRNRNLVKLQEYTDGTKAKIETTINPIERLEWTDRLRNYGLSYLDKLNKGSDGLVDGLQKIADRCSKDTAENLVQQVKTLLEFQERVINRITKLIDETEKFLPATVLPARVI